MTNRLTVGHSPPPTHSILVTRTVVGNALPESRFPPIRLPGRTLLLISRPFWPVSILPIPTPDRALSLARYMDNGNRLLYPFLSILLVVKRTFPAMALLNKLILRPDVVVVCPTLINVQTILTGTPLTLTPKPLRSCRARVFYNPLVVIPILFNELRLTSHLTYFAFLRRSPCPRMRPPLQHLVP